MFVKQYGQGPQAFFCLHGWSGDHRTFEPLIPFLPQDARMYCADLPGCGNSAAPRQWNLQTVTSEIVHAMEETDTGGLTIVGSCIGALLGMCAALRKPDLVQRLILVDAFAEWPWYFKIFTAPGWGKYAYASTFANPVGRWITNQALASKRSQESDLTSDFAGQRHDVTLNYLHLLREIQSASEFASLDVPVDVVFGSRTFRAVQESAVIWKDMWPRTLAWQIPNTGHLVLQEAAAAVSEIVFGGKTCQAVSVPTSNNALA